MNRLIATLAISATGLLLAAECSTVEESKAPAQNDCPADHITTEASESSLYKHCAPSVPAHQTYGNAGQGETPEQVYDMFPQPEYAHLFLESDHTQSNNTGLE